MKLLAGTVIGGRFTIVRHLGGGGQSATYVATDAHTTNELVVKVLALRGLESWKLFDLWHRECAVLRDLRHPRIPTYIDDFKEDVVQGHEAALLFCLVQSKVAGQDLKQLREAGRTFDEPQLLDIIRQSLRILTYLHERVPPVLHRDIKPSNLMLGPDDQVHLIDFGTVQTVTEAGPEGGSTIVGTHGYMAPEQLQGRASAASDLYGLAATVVFLASGQVPGDMPVSRMRVQFEAATELSAHLETWLGKMLAPIAEDRFDSAQAALAAVAIPGQVAVAKPAVKPAVPFKPVQPWPTWLRVLVAVAFLVFFGWLVQGQKLPKRGKAPAVATKRGAQPTATAVASKSNAQHFATEITRSDTTPSLQLQVELSTVECFTIVPKCSMRLAGTLSNTGLDPVTEVALQVFGYDAEGVLVYGKPMALLYSWSVMLEPSEVRNFTQSAWDVPNSLHKVRLEVRRVTTRKIAAAQLRQAVALRWAAPQPPDVGLKLVLRRMVTHPYGKDVNWHWEIVNTGTLTVTELTVEFAANDGKPAKGPVNIVPSTLQVLKSGSHAVVLTSTSSTRLPDAEVVSITAGSKAHGW